MRTKGLPEVIGQNGNIVEIWCSSPDGDESDSQILKIRCADDVQALQVFEAWSNMVGLVNTQ